MPYEAPAGWLEPVPGRTQFERDTQVFHRQADCPAIGSVVALSPTDRPFGALRCRRCGRID